MKKSMLLVMVVLSGCASVQRVSLPAGSGKLVEGLKVDCEYGNMATCESTASESCPKGYDVLQRSDRTSYDVGYGVVVGGHVNQKVERFLIIRCNG